MDVNRWIAFAIVAVLALAAPAAAEPIRLAQNAASGVLPPYEVITIIRSAGLDPLSRPLRRGPHFAMHAVDRDGSEVRVLVDARSGRIVSLTPVEVATRLPPGLVLEDDEPPPLSGRLPSRVPELYEAEPPVVVYEGGRRVIYEDEMPVTRGPRPPADVTMSTGPRSSAVPPARANAPAVSEPRVITAIEPGRDGLLPPPPERFPQRSPASPAKSKPTKRAAAEIAKQPPLPKPRPSVSVTPATPNPAGKSPVEQLPN